MTTSTPSRSANRPPWRVRAMRRSLRGMPKPRYPVGYEPDLTVPAADGSTLLADRYFPLADGDFHTLLVRSPYGRGLPWASMYGALFAEQGFCVVLQSCRGTGGSGGEFVPWRNEAADGQATVDWLRDQPWFSGVLGTVGASYLGYVQWALALDPPSELRAMAVHVGLHDPYAFFYSGDAFCLENALVASTAMIHQGRGAWQFARSTMRLRRRLREVTDALPLVDGYVPGIGERAPFLEEAMTHCDAEDTYWQGADAGAAADQLAVPTCLITGWNDVSLEQTLRQYGRLRRAGCEAALLIGPWTHTSALGRGWPEAFSESLGWLRAHMYDDPSGLRPTRVRVHVGGVSRPRDLPDWPPSTAGVQWYPDAGGALDTRPPSDTSPPLSLRYDPADPTPSVGGPLLSNKAGYRNNAAVEARDDVLVFTSAPLVEPIEILGPVGAEVRVGTGHADVFARLCDVDPRGRSRNVCDGLLRLRPDGGDAGPVTATVAMASTAYRFPAGHRIRLQISGGAHPRFARNTGTAEPYATTTRLVPADITIHHPSALTLPVAPAR